MSTNTTGWFKPPPGYSPSTPTAAPKASQQSTQSTATPQGKWPSGDSYEGARVYTVVAAILNMLEGGSASGGAGASNGAGAMNGNSGGAGGSFDNGAGPGFGAKSANWAAQSSNP